MTLDQFGSIGEIVGAVGVVVSLVYLAIQIRKNTETERTSTYQSIVSDFGALNNTMASTPELSHLFVRAMENYHQLSADEKARVSQLFLTMQAKQSLRKDPCQMSSFAQSLWGFTLTPSVMIHRALITAMVIAKGSAVISMHRWSR
jgi:hypothetical protein